MEKWAKHVLQRYRDERQQEADRKRQPGGEMTITDHGQPLAQVKKVERTSWPCKAGSYRKVEFRMAPDFDAPLEEFKEYME